MIFQREFNGSESNSKLVGDLLTMLDADAAKLESYVSRQQPVSSETIRYCVPVGSVTEMAKIIKGLADDRERVAKIGLRAHATIGAQISYEQYVNWFLQMVRSLWLEAPRYWPVDRPLRLAQAPEPAPN